MEQLPSNQFKINWRDIAKSFAVAFISAVLMALSAIIDAGDLPTFPQIKTALYTGLVAGIAYLIKNFLTDSVKASQKVVDDAKQKQADKYVNN